MWTAWFSRNKKNDSPRPSLRDLTFDTSGLRVAKKATDVIEWVDPQNDHVIARIERGVDAVANVPWALDALRMYWRNKAAVRDGGIVSATFDHAGGVPFASAITKFSDAPGYVYEGTAMVRFREAVYTLTLVASEHGQTGTREAITTALLFSLGELRVPVVVPPAKSAKLEGFTSDPYDDSYAGPTLCSLADDERLDELVPSHPLSKVRRWLATVKQSLAVAPDLTGELVDPPVTAASGNEARHRVPPYAMGILLLQSGRLDRAERVLAEAVPFRNGEPVLEAHRVADTLLLLGVARENLGQLREAVWAFEWSVRAFSATVGDRDPQSVRARSNLGRAYAALGRASDAEPLLREAITMFEAQQNDSELGVAFNALGLVCQAQNDHAEALTCFERALSLFEKLQGPDYFECATVLRNLARSADAAGDAVRGKRALTRALKIPQHRKS